MAKIRKSSPRELNSGGWVVNRKLEDLIKTIDKYGDMLEESTLARPDLGVDWWTAEYIAEHIENAIGELQKYADELRQYANSGERKPIEEWQNAFDKSTKKSKMKKSGNWWSTLNEYNGVSYDSLKVDYAQLVDLFMKPNGDVVALYDMGDTDCSGKLEYMLKGLFGEANPITGMDYSSDNRNLRKPQDFVVGNIYKSTKKSKMKKSLEPGKDWEYDIPQERDFINEVYENGVVVGLELADRGAYRTFEYNGEHYEVYESPTLRDENNPKGIGFMLRQSPEPDYSVVTFDLFKQTITDYIHQWESEGDNILTLDDYTFHDNGNGHYTFSYDSLVYELMNYEDPAVFKDGLERALEDAGFEWGVTIEYDTYSDLGFYNHYEMKSTKKSKKPDIGISFEASVNSLRKTNYAKCGNINTIVKERK